MAPQGAEHCAAARPKPFLKPSAAFWSSRDLRMICCSKALATVQTTPLWKLKPAGALTKDKKRFLRCLFAEAEVAPSLLPLSCFQPLVLSYPSLVLPVLGVWLGIGISHGVAACS